MCSSDLPEVTTTNAVDITASAATIRGRVRPYVASTVTFEYGTRADLSGDARAVTLEDKLPPQELSVPVEYRLGSLKENQTYYYRVSASNESGTGRGAVESFTTKGATVSATPAPGTTATSPSAAGGGTAPTAAPAPAAPSSQPSVDRKSTRLNSSH